MAEQHHSQRQPLVCSGTAQYQVQLLVMPWAPGEVGTDMERSWKEQRIIPTSQDEKEISRKMKPDAKEWQRYQRMGGSVQKTCMEWEGRRRWVEATVVKRCRKLRWERGERRRGREFSAALLPVLVKCCVLSKRQPRMCQPSRLTLPNGLLNADIKLSRSFTLPFSPLSLSVLPLLLALITSGSHPVSHSVTHLSSPSLSLFQSIKHSPFFFCGHPFSSSDFSNYISTPL